MAIVLIPILLLFSEKYIPLFLLGILIVSIGYAALEPAELLTSLGTYFLLSLFQFSLWSIANQLNLLEEETIRLNDQRKVLLDKDAELKLLSLQEFVEQAFWMLKTNRRDEYAWLMEIVPAIDCPLLIEGLERAALVSIAKNRDLVTSKRGTVYLLVRRTEKQSLQPLLKRLEQAMVSENQSTGYEIKKTAITKVSEMVSLIN